MENSTKSKTVSNETRFKILVAAFKVGVVLGGLLTVWFIATR